MIERCTTPTHTGWLALRSALWPGHDDSVHRAEMAVFCAAPERFAQFIAYAAPGTPHGLVEIALRHDYVNGTRSSSVAFLEGIYVVPLARRRGVARALVAVAEDWARGCGCSEFASDAAIRNRSSHAMHRAFGFEETERVVFFRKAL